MLELKKIIIIRGKCVRESRIAKGMYISLLKKNNNKKINYCGGREVRIRNEVGSRV